MEISEAVAEDRDISITHAQPIEVPDDDEPVITNVIVSKYQSQKQSLYPRAPLKSLENPLMFGSSFYTKNLEIVTIGFLVKF